MMYYCENCCSEITSEVFGTGDDATGWCDNCKEHVNCYDDEENRSDIDGREIGV